MLVPKLEPGNEEKRGKRNSPQATLPPLRFFVLETTAPDAWLVAVIIQSYFRPLCAIQMAVIAGGQAMAR